MGCDLCSRNWTFWGQKRTVSMLCDDLSQTVARFILTQIKWKSSFPELLPVLFRYKGNQYIIARHACVTNQTWHLLPPSINTNVTPEGKKKQKNFSALHTQNKGPWGHTACFKTLASNALSNVTQSTCFFAFFQHLQTKKKEQKQKSPLGLYVCVCVYVTKKKQRQPEF